MKKTLLVALLLTFLVGCSQAEQKVEEVKETVSTEVEKATETNTEEAPAELEFVGLALNKNTVIATAEGVEQVVTLEAKDNPELMQGHKYEFVFNPANIADGKISVETATMSGKKIPFTVSPEVALKALEAVENKLVVDIRSAEEFAKGSLEGAINLPEADLEKSLEGKTVADFNIQGRDTVLLVIGGAESDTATAAQTLYTVFNTNVVLEAGDYANFKAE